MLGGAMHRGGAVVTATALCERGAYHQIREKQTASSSMTETVPYDGGGVKVRAR